MERLDAPWQSDPTWLDGIEPSAIKKKDWTLIREVLEYAQTETGKWYPARIRSRSRYIRPKETDIDNPPTTERILSIYLQETTEFPDGIFDPTQLPSAVVASISGTGLVPPQSQEIRQQHDNTTCKKHLRRIGNCIALYVNDYAEQYPPNLRILVEKEDLPHQSLRCPSSEATDDEPSYVYRGADLDVTLPPNMIAAYDKSENHQGQFRNVLFLGLQVKQMTEDEFLAEIARDNEIRRQNGLVPKPAE